VRELIREAVGYSPYERRMLELLRNGLDKRAQRIAKKRVRPLFSLFLLLLYFVDITSLFV